MMSGLLLLGSGLAAWRLEAGPSIYTDGLSAEQPSALQLAAMASWYQQNVAPAGFAGVRGRFGCVVYSMAMRHFSAHRSAAYTQVMCQQCPPSDLGGWTPAVFFLDGVAITSANVVTAAGDPGYFDEIKRYFPRQLWSAANNPTISGPEAELYVVAAYQIAACGK